MNLKNINFIGNDCCGCEACYSICPKNAIYYERGSRGELFYKANENCINCGRCLKVCSANNAVFHVPSKVFYKGVTKNKSTLKKSSSGGIAYEIANQIISEGGIVYGTIWNVKEQKVCYERIVSKENLTAIQGSKYVHSAMGKKIYKSILKDVQRKKILFIGCPCQVSAVKNLVGNNDNLTCIDLICHGVPSEEMLQEQLKILTKNDIVSLSFRKGLDFTLDVKDSEGNEYSVKGYDNPYYALFLSFSSLREKCYSCKYAQRERVGDLTIGDYTENGKGYSCVIANSDKGKKIIERSKTFIEYEERDAELLINNDALNHPTIKNQKVEVFTKRYNERGLYFAYYRTFYVFVCKRMMRKILGDKIYDTIIDKIKLLIN